MSEYSLENIIKSYNTLPEDFAMKCFNIWNDVSRETQEKKLTQNGIHDNETRIQILNQLIMRPSLLVHVFNEVKKTTAGSFVVLEVGTAQGLQSLTFASCFPDCEIWTCDIKDDRDLSFEDFKNVNFVNGDANLLSSELKKNNTNVATFCWIDGSHDKGFVTSDFLHLLKHTDSRTVWAFDDFDKRFGCYDDIETLLKHFNEHVVIDLGKTASGNDNRIVIARGCTAC